MNVVFDMETSDPDDFLTLLRLLGHPHVTLRAVTITPGTKEQVGLVRQALTWFGRTDIYVGAFNLDHVGNCVSEWHYKAYRLEKVESNDAEEGWAVLDRTLGVGTTLICGAALKNLGALLHRMRTRIYDRPPCLGRAFIQGGFAGEGVVPPENQLEKFKGKVTCPTFNLNGDPQSALSVLERRAWFSDLRFVSKNVCHGVKYDKAMHAEFEALRTTWCSHPLCTCACHTGGVQMLHFMECCFPCPRCEQNLPGHPGPATSPMAQSQSLIYQGMAHYLGRHADGKAFHDPLAACCALNPDIGMWAEVELYRERGEWGSYLLEGSGVKIITGYDHTLFVNTLLGGANAEDV